jgi:hypothetical protein
MGYRMGFLPKLSIFVTLACAMAFAQRKVDIGNMYERVLCVVPVVGKGTMDDPRRPLFANLPVRKGPPTRDGILAFSWIPSDDGKFALVEFVARNRVAFQAVATANRPDVRVFHKGRNSRAEIETEFRRYRQSFSLDQLRTILP